MPPSDDRLSWLAEGVALAEAAGGVTLELYRAPGFTGGLAVRRVTGEGAAAEAFAPVEDAEGDTPTAPQRD
jgi:hypothetical protein